MTHKGGSGSNRVLARNGGGVSLKAVAGDVPRRHPGRVSEFNVRRLGGGRLSHDFLDRPGTGE